MKKILVVDDEPAQRRLLSNLLQHAPHYQVIEVHDGLSALEALKKEQIDLIILDVRMPVMDGFATLVVIRENPELSHIPVIMCTAVDEREEVMRILQQGVTDYILKPIDNQTLLQKVQWALTIVDDASDGTVAAENYRMRQVRNLLADLALIADGDGIFRSVVRKILNPYYDIIEASNGASAERLIIDRQPQVILLGRLSGASNALDILHKLRSIIQRENIKVYRLFSAPSEALSEQVLREYHGRMIRTLDTNLLRSRLRQMMALPDFEISCQGSIGVVTLKNCYPQTDRDSRMLLRAIAVVLADAPTVRFDLSDWASESTDTCLRAQKIASQYLEDIITELKSLDIKIEITGYTPPEDSSLSTLLTNLLAESEGEYIDYLTSQIDKLQQYYEKEDWRSIASSGRDLNNFGKERGFPRISLLADMLVRESNNVHWDVVEGDVVEALIQQLLREQKKIAKDSVQ